eukprot:TRINITY_DN16634_c0_g1_i2.p2 TRINITY_DN16634_c0_g1~~TRINITY_DN16634_c0_g1_i2.p2  ORF type:complete len:265 (-),score=58.11 TRINITY_DN16634_c0_g1_i2:227-1021(-)
MAGSSRLFVFAVLATIALAKRASEHAGDEKHNARALQVSIGPIASEMTAAFRRLEHVIADQIKVRELHEVVWATAEALEKTGFDAAAKEIKKNVDMLSTCPDFQGEGIVGACLAAEEGKCIKEAKNWRPACAIQDKSKHKPAVLADPSPSMGIFWFTRTLWFMAEMFEKVSSGQTMAVAGTSAYENRIQVAFGKCTMCTDYVTNKLVKSSLAGGLADEDKYYAMLGGKDEAVNDMKAFATVALPVIRSIFDLLVEHNLDGSNGY